MDHPALRQVQCHAAYVLVIVVSMRWIASALETDGCLKDNQDTVEYITETCRRRLRYRLCHAQVVCRYLVMYANKELFPLYTTHYRSMVHQYRNNIQEYVAVKKTAVIRLCMVCATGRIYVVVITITCASARRVCAHSPEIAKYTGGSDCASCGTPHGH